MTAKRLGMIGAAGLMVGGALLGTAVAASAGTPTLTLSSNSGFGNTASPVLVTASGFTKKTKGGLSQCPIVSGEPTILDVTTGQQEPVGCQPFSPIKTNTSGKLPNPTGFSVAAGVNGPPDSGTDSAGTDAKADAQNYPCPPTAGQIAAGGSCAVVYTDTLGETASATITYTFESTTTTTGAPIAGCTAKPATVTTGSATVTVTPATCLVGNQKVTVTASGLAATNLGSLLECNGATGEPTVFVALANKGVPVGCTAIGGSSLVTTAADGSLPANTMFTILTGTIGPPAAGTDSAGVNAATDSANYPCPPTAAQQAAGVTCAIAFGDLAGDQVVVPISFGANAGNTGNGSTAAASGSSTTKPATKAKSSSLAFTGAGPGLWIMGIVGIALILLGGSLLVVVDAPRRLLRPVRGGRDPRDSGS